MLKKKIHAFVSDKFLGKKFICSVGCWSIFHCKKFGKYLKKWHSVGKKSYVVEEAELHSVIFSISEALVVWYAVQCWPEEMGSFWKLTSAGFRPCSFSLCLHNSLSILLRCNSVTRTQHIMNQAGGRPPNSSQNFLKPGESLALGSALEPLLSPTTELVDWQSSYIIHFFVIHHNPIEKWFIVVKNKGQQFKPTICCSWRTHLPSCFTFLIYFKYKMTINGPHSDFGSFSYSYKRISFDDALRWSLPTSGGLSLCSTSRHLFSFANLFKHHCGTYVL